MYCLRCNYDNSKHGMSIPYKVKITPASGGVGGGSTDCTQITVSKKNAKFPDISHTLNSGTNNQETRTESISTVYEIVETGTSN